MMEGIWAESNADGKGGHVFYSTIQLLATFIAAVSDVVYIFHQALDT